MDEQRWFDESMNAGGSSVDRVWRGVVGEHARADPVATAERSRLVAVAALAPEPPAIDKALGAVERQLAHLAEAIERRGDDDQLGLLNGSVESLADRLGRLERMLTLVSEERWNAARPTTRANPMTHPVTPVTHPDGAADRADALASVRALFQARPRSWWQRLPGLPRG